MTAFHIHNEEGFILQSNKVYSPEGYEQRLHDFGYHRFVIDEKGQVAHPDSQFCYNGELSMRPDFEIGATNLEIVAGGSVPSLFTNIPPGTKILVQAGGIQVWEETVPGNFMEFTPPVPGVYVITFRKWPYRDFVRQVVGLEP